MTEKASFMYQGSIQAERLCKSLGSGYFELEERDLKHYLRQAYAYAKNIKYINDDNQVDGDWSSLLDTNDTVMLAVIAAHCSQQSQDRFKQLLSMHDNNLKILHAMVVLCVDLVKQLDQWHAKLRRIETETAQLAAQKLFDLIQNSSEEFNELGGIYNFVSNSVNESNSKRMARITADQARIFEDLATRWSIKGNPVQVVEDTASKDYISFRLENIFYDFLNGMQHFSDFCDQRLTMTLSGGGQDPSSALLVTFLQLLKKVNQRTNGFLDQHRDFYYRDILKLSQRQGLPDRTILVVQVNPNNSERTLLEGTAFVATGNSPSQESNYLAIADLNLIPAKVTSIANCCLGQVPFNVPAYDLGMVSNVRAQSIEDYSFLNAEWNQMVPQNINPLGKGKSLFGDNLDCVESEDQEDSELGFLLSSEILRSERCHRRIDVRLILEERERYSVDQSKPTSRNAMGQFKSRVLSTFRHYIIYGEKRYKLSELQNYKLKLERLFTDNTDELYSFSEAAEKSLSALGKIFNLDCKSLRNKIFSEGFELYVSCQSGWHKIDAFQCDYSAGPLNHICHFMFELDDSQEAVIAYDKGLHKISFTDQFFSDVQIDTPVLKIVLAKHAEFYLYSFLQNLVLYEVSIDIDITGVKSLVLHNDSGPVDYSSPFQPFGAVPALGNYLIVSSQDFSCKKLKYMKVNIQWHQLPKNIGGFSDHYREYDLGICNEDFSVTTTVLRNGVWASQSGSNCQPLFNLDSQQTLARNVCIEIPDADYFQPLADCNTEICAYSAEKLSGFIRLQLSGRSPVFAHQAYPHVLNKKLLAALKTKQMSEQLNEPYTPVIDHISVDYKASETINVQQHSQSNRHKKQSQIFSLQPFGLQSLTPNTRLSDAYLLPQYQQSNHFYLGLILLGNHYGDNTISIYFDLQESTIRDARPSIPVIDWWWLSEGYMWEKIPRTDVLADTTEGFLQSGIIHLRLPHEAFYKGEDYSLGTSTSLFSDLKKIWIRISSPESGSLFCQLRGVEINAIEVRRQHFDNRELNSLPAQSISKALKTHSAFSMVYQPRASLSGRVKENQKLWLQRSSERLRHRNRLVTPWDFERCVLQEFEFVQKVKCFPAMSQKNHNSELLRAPGKLLLIVIPCRQHNSDIDLCQPPPIVSGSQLNRIKIFLNRLSAPGVDIEVCNPQYETIQVRCSVIFTQDVDQLNPPHALNTALVDYISSWGCKGPSKQFDWSFCEDDITAFIQDQPYVDFVTNVSLLKVTSMTGGVYKRTDSAIENGSSSNSSDSLLKLSKKQTLTPQWPWCLALPAKNHAVEIINNRQVIPAKATGYGDLQIGTNFIINETQTNTTENG
jgi:hypothetical protein